jgi:hypothetical protein
VTHELSILGALTADDDHMTAEALLTSHGWTRCGVADSGPWDPVGLERMRASLAAADARLG